MHPLFERFLKERKYLKNVAPTTIEWHTQSLRWLGVEDPTPDNLNDFVMRMRDAGLKPISCNNRIRSVNAYLRWAGIPHRVSRLKEEQRILPVFSPADVKKLVAHKPRGFCPTRLHVLVLTLLDIGCRIGEALELRWVDVNFDDLLLKLHGKGAKDRMVPFSFELRRHLFRWQQRNRCDLVFCTPRGQRISHRNTLRDVKLLCKELGIQAPARTLHSFRHTFASNYLRRGGSVFHLQKCLGHSTLEMSRRYANLLTEDLSAIHEKISLLTTR